MSDPSAPGRSAEGRWTQGLARAGLAGFIWLTILFVADTIDSVSLLARGVRHVDADGAVAEMLRDAVVDYVVQVGAAHVVMAVVAGLLLHLVMRLWFAAPVSQLRWWSTTVVVACLITLLGYGRHCVTYPTLYDGFSFRTTLVDSFTPPSMTLLQLTVLVLFLGLRFLAWGRRSPGTFARRLLALLAAVGLVGLTQLPPPPDTPSASSPASSAASSAGPNIVLIGVDSLRPDHLSANGYHRPTSPNMDALLAESVVFSSTWSPVARTYPAWMSLLTGTWPTTHGIRDNLPMPDELVPSLPLLPALLQEAGYHTAFATDDSRFSYMVPELGWSRIHQPPVGLTNFVVSSNEPRYRIFHAFMHNALGFAMVPSQRHNQAYGKSYRPALFNGAVVEQLAEASEQDRFFVALHSCVLHHPGDRNWPYTRMFGQQGYDRRNRFRYARSPTSFEISDEGDEEIAEDYAEQDERIYDTGVVMADELVGEVMAALREGDLLDDTIVVLFSDHGEELWAPDLPYRYGGPNHGFHLFGSAQNQVVLAVRMPDGEGAGTTVSDPVRLTDLAPTLAELVGVSWPGELDGESLVPLIEGGTEAVPRLVYMETGVSEKRYWVPGHKNYPYRRIQERYEVDQATGRVSIAAQFRPHLIAAKDRAVQIGRWKLVWHAVQRGTKFGLYDVQEDPLQRHDLARDERDRVAWLGSQLAPFLRGDGDDNGVLEIWEDDAADLDPVQLLGPSQSRPQEMP